MNPHAAERRNRIRLAVAAWAYEHGHHPTMSDKGYDNLSQLIRPRLATGNSRLDHFFRRHFTPDSGLWVHKHPEPGKLAQIYFTIYAPLYQKRRRQKRR